MATVLFSETSMIFYPTERHHIAAEDTVKLSVYIIQY
jgi:hypothetical protein